LTPLPSAFSPVFSPVFYSCCSPVVLIAFLTVYPTPAAGPANTLDLKLLATLLLLLVSLKAAIDFASLFPKVY
jgi:hypothetical protein